MKESNKVMLRQLVSLFIIQSVVVVVVIGVYISVVDQTDSSQRR